MNNRILTLLAGTSVLAATAAANAQTTGQPDLQEVVVTATRRDELLQDVPISISVFNQEQLAAHNIVSIGDLATYTPSLQVDKGDGNDNTSFAIRGFSSVMNTAATVGVFFADVVAPRGGVVSRSGDGAGPGSTFDLENIQVLKGPQGTLFGRNTVGGDVLIVPKKPTDEFQGYGEVSYGNYDMVRGQGVLNLPLNDKIRLRIGFDRESQDGYMRNISGVGPSNFDNTDYVAGRVSLDMDITESLENYTIGSYIRSDDNGPGTQLYRCNPTPPAGTPKTAFSLGTCAEAAAIDAAGPYAMENPLPNANSFFEQYQVINTTTWTATDSLKIKNIASYGQIRSVYNNENFGDFLTTPKSYGATSGIVLPLTNVITFPGLDIGDQRTVTEELQFQGDSLQNKLVWQAGGYFEASDPLGLAGVRGITLLDCSNLAQLQCFDPIGKFDSALAHANIAAGSLNQSLATVTYRDVAAYGQATYALTDELKLTGGLRDTYDTTRTQSDAITYKFPGPTWMSPVGRCAANGAAIVGNPDELDNSCGASNREDSHAPTWLLDLDYSPDKDKLYYLKYSRGYRAGSIVPIGAPGENVFQPEHVDAYEGGAKMTFHGAVPTVLDFAGFYNNYTNQQLQVSFENPGTGALKNAIVNAGRSRIWGAEFEGSVKPLPSLRLEAAYTYLNTKIVQITPVVPSAAAVTAGYTTVIGSVQAGDPLPDSPQNKAIFTATYTLPVAEAVGVVSVSSTYTYQDSQFVASLPYRVELPSVGLLHFNADWSHIAGRPIDVQLFMTNALNKLYTTSEQPIYTVLGVSARQLGEPRMFGARLRYSF
jgi:iron complex outermembrane recepter protein